MRIRGCTSNTHLVYNDRCPLKTSKRRREREREEQLNEDVCEGFPSLPAAGGCGVYMIFIGKVKI